MYNQITTSAEPSVIGVNNGVYQLEFKGKELKKNTNYKAISEILLNFDINDFLKSQDSIKGIEISTLKAHLLKKAKLTDIMTFSPYFLGYKYIVSQRVVDCLRKFENIEESYHLREIKIDGIKDKYYLFFINMIPSREINFSKSSFYIEDKGHIQINTYEEYLEQIEKTPFLEEKKIVLSKKYSKRKIISVQGVVDVFLSNDLLTVLTEHNTSNLIVRNKGCELIFD